MLVAALCLTAVTNDPAALAAASDPWETAAAQVTFPLYRPTVTLGFRLARVRFQRCGDSGNSLVAGLYTKGSGTRQPLLAFTEEYPQPCGNPGESMTVTTVDVNGDKVAVNVFCYSPGPKCTVEDGMDNGFLLYLRGPGAKPTGITVTSRYVALEDLLPVVRSLARVSGPRGPPAPVTPASGSCSMAEATRVVERLGLRNAADPTVRKPVAQVLCGAFLGPGSQAMVASLAIPSCGRTAGWVVFRRSGASWQGVMERHNGAVLDAVGTGIRETQFVLRPGDAHCFPTGGTRSRTWRWNGSRFTAGPWVTNAKRAPAPSTSAFTSGFFKTPSANIQCIYRYGGGTPAGVVCGIKSGLEPPPPRRGPRCSTPNRVSLDATGRAGTSRSICPGEPEGDAGPFIGGQPGGPLVAVLAYGTTWSHGGLRCASESTGLTCRNAQGHGFFLSRERWRAF